MEKNYYKILEIDKDASPEIIKKAYTTLAKKYHPDLQDVSVKHIYEEKLKLINEAYEVLSDEEKRKQYDMELLEIEPDVDDLLNENYNLKNELNNMRNNNTSNVNRPNYQGFNNNTQEYQNDEIYREQELEFKKQRQQELEYQRQMQQAREQAYHDAYIQDLKNRGYKIRYRKTLKEYIKNFIALILTIFVLFLLWQIPFIKKFFINMYNENVALKYIINFIKSLFN